MFTAKCRTKKNKGGFTLFYAVLVSSLLLAIGLAILNITLKEFTLSSGARDSETAFYAADSALECALYWDHTLRPFGYYGDRLAEDLVGYWRFEETAEQQAENPPLIIDSSGNGYFGAAFGGPTWAEGAIDQGLSFDGVDDYVELTKDVQLSGDFTISAWITVPLDDRNQFVVSGLPSGETVNGTRFGFKWDAANLVFQYLVQIDGGTAGVFNVDPKIRDGGFYHFVWRREGDDIDLIVDDSPVTTFSSQEGDVRVGAIGWNITTLGAFYSGMIDDVRIYERALSDNEIKALHDGDILAGFVPPIDTEFTPGITCAEDDINDASGWWEYDVGKTGWHREDTSPEDLNSDDWVTLFDVMFSNNTCGRVEVFKDDTGSTTVISRGYNTCDVENPRAVERAIKARY